MMNDELRQFVFYYSDFQKSATFLVGARTEASAGGARATLSALPMRDSIGNGFSRAVALNADEPSALRLTEEDF